MKELEIQAVVVGAGYGSLQRLPPTRQRQQTEGEIGPIASPKDRNLESEAGYACVSTKTDRRRMSCGKEGPPPPEIPTQRSNVDAVE